MASVNREHPALPTERDIEQAAEGSRKLAAILGDGETAQLCVIDGKEQITVPFAAVRLLRDILTQMSQGNAVSVLPIGHTLTTQQAADLLNVSRPYLIKQLEAKELPCSKVGRHRRIKYQDLLAYMEKVDAQSREALNELTKQAQKLGMGY